VLYAAHDTYQQRNSRLRLHCLRLIHVHNFTVGSSVVRCDEINFIVGKKFTVTKIQSQIYEQIYREFLEVKVTEHFRSA